MSGNTEEAILEINSYINADYHVREQSRLLGMFDRVVIESTCEGHIEVEEWSNPNEKGICRQFSRYRFVPGLKLVQGTESNLRNRLPEVQYILDGKPISVRELMVGYRGVGRLVLLPAEQLYDRAQRGNLKKLEFNVSHLYFSEFNVNNKQTKQLEEGLNTLYLEYKKSIPLSIMKKNGFCFPSMDFLVYDDYDMAIEHRADGFNTIRRSNISKDYGSIEKYWSSVIDEVIELQKKSWGIWGEIGTLCDHILNK